MFRPRSWKKPVGLTEELYGTKDSFSGVLHLPC